jgi:hypothetical protein
VSLRVEGAPAGSGTDSVPVASVTGSGPICDRHRLVIGQRPVQKMRPKMRPRPPCGTCGAIPWLASDRSVRPRESLRLAAFQSPRRKPETRFPGSERLRHRPTLDAFDREPSPPPPLFIGDPEFEPHSDRIRSIAVSDHRIAGRLQCSALHSAYSFSSPLPWPLVNCAQMKSWLPPSAVALTCVKRENAPGPFPRAWRGILAPGRGNVAGHRGKQNVGTE